MIPGNDLLLKCPYCQTTMTVMSIISGNSGGSVKWSDGYTVMPMYPQNSEVQQCDKCKHYFWLNQKNICAYTDSMTGTLSVLTLSQWYGALEQFQKEKLLTKDDELEIRLQILWEYNHGIRAEYSKADFVENSNRLLMLMNRDGEKYLIMSAEIYRELGLYNKCLDLLHAVNLDSWGCEIEEAAKRKTSNVFRLRNNNRGFSIFM